MSKECKQRLLSGYTVVELLVVITTMILLFSLGYAGYRSFQRRQYLESAVRMIKADLELARQMALIGKKPPNCLSLEGYLFRRIEVTPNVEYHYRLESVCNDGQDCYNDINFCIKEVALPSGLTMEPLALNDKFYFIVLGRGIDRATNVTIRVNFPGSGVSPRTVIVTPGGEIR